MPPEAIPTGWFDDVAMAAVSGQSSIVVAVCGDLGIRDDLTDWLESAIPSLSREHTELMFTSATDLYRTLADRSQTEDPVTVVVHDAAEGDERVLVERWEAWNRQRELLRGYLIAVHPRASLVFLTTSTRMPEIATAAPDLLSIARVITVMEDPFAADPKETDLVRELTLVEQELVKRYGLTTEELVRRLLSREQLAVPHEDRQRWQAIAAALRNIDGSQ